MPVPQPAVVYEGYRYIAAPLRGLLPPTFLQHAVLTKCVISTFAVRSLITILCESYKPLLLGKGGGAPAVSSGGEARGGGGTGPPAMAPARSRSGRPAAAGDPPCRYGSLSPCGGFSSRSVAAVWPWRLLRGQAGSG